MSPPKHVDLLVLAAALAVFVLAGLPMIGYAAYALLAQWIRSRNYRKVSIAAVTALAAAAAFYGGVVYPMTHQPAISTGLKAS